MDGKFLRTYLFVCHHEPIDLKKWKMDDRQRFHNFTS